MRIILITPIYSTTTSNQGTTPVVHYFAREWVRMGHSVIVYHFEAKFLRLMYWVGRHFRHQLNTKLGMLVPTESPLEGDYVEDGVIIHKRCLKKIIPHSRYSRSQIQRALNFIEQECERSGCPDWFIGHWDNPQLEILNALRSLFKKPVCLVLHENHFSFEKKYGEDGLALIKSIDIIGFRSPIGLFNFEKKYGKPRRSFIASSGVSPDFLTVGKQINKIIHQPVRNFIFVGSLISRKYPVSILTALSRVYQDGDFTLTFVGDGAEMETIKAEHEKNGGLGEIRFTGRIPRESIIKYLKEADVFVMVSKGEIFGLVYLEAMALGLIPIGSKREGIDGIIRDNENGFLCEAGNVDELSKVLVRIKQMSNSQLEQLSSRAKETAFDYSDEAVATRYIKELTVE